MRKCQLLDDISLHSNVESYEESCCIYSRPDHEWCCSCKSYIFLVSLVFG